MTTAAEIKAQVLDAAKTMYARGLVEGTAGNVSGRVDEAVVAMTPSSLSYEAMTLEDIVLCDLEGTVVEGDRSPTSEKGLHLSCYQLYPEVQGVVHCHAKSASMFAVAHKPIPAGIDEFIVYIGGDVPICDYKASGSDELGPTVAASLIDRSAALMANHGMVCVGKSVDDALHSALVVEHNAQIMWGAMMIGGVVPIPEKTQKNFAGVYDFIRHQMWGAG